MSYLSDPFHALIEAEQVISKITPLMIERQTRPASDPLYVTEQDVSSALKRVRAALEYLREHPLHEYVKPEEADPRD